MNVYNIIIHKFPDYFPNLEITQMSLIDWINRLWYTHAMGYDTTRQ